MSLINQVLRDLDQRRAPALDAASVPDAVRAVGHMPNRRSQPATVLLLIAALFLATLTSLWLLLRPEPQMASVSSVTPPSITPSTTATPATPPPVALIKPEAKPQPKAEPKQEPKAEPKPEPKPVTKPESKTEAKPALNTKPLPQPEPQASSKPEKKPKPESNAKNPAMAPPAELKPAASDAKAIEPATKITTTPNLPPPTPAITSSDGEAEFRAAMALAQAGKKTDAITGLLNTLRLNKTHHPARQAAITLLIGQERKEEAMSHLKEGLQLQPNNFTMVKSLARLYLDLGKLPEATRLMNEHAPAGAADSDYVAFHALLLHKQNRMREAIDRYRAALKMRPNDARLWYGLALALEAEKETKSSFDAFSKAKEIGGLPPDLAASIDQRINR